MLQHELSIFLINLEGSSMGWTVFLTVRAWIIIYFGIKKG